MDAACRGEDPSLWFVERGHDYAEACKICARCPVFDECLEYAVAENLDMGVFAGLSAGNRRQVARAKLSRYGLPVSAAATCS
jgi:WhiB family redox-sensing transcriptional regulator